jgi:hypothetical protein
LLEMIERRDVELEDALHVAMDFRCEDPCWFRLRQWQ